MKKYLFLQLPASYLKIFSWLIVGIIMLVSLKAHPINSIMLGDEPGYFTELDYLNHYGFYQSLAQGMSFGYTGLLFIFSKLIPINAFFVMKFFSAGCYVACCLVILKIFDRFENIAFETKYLGMVFFAYFSSSSIWRALPDVAHCLAILLAILALLNKGNYKQVVIASLMVFFAFTIKPIAIFYIPGILLYFLVNKSVLLKQRIVNILLFIVVFTSCFVVYHIPGYQTYGKLMLEDKGHMYVGSKRINATTTWNEINTYFEVYNPNKRVNKWHVTVDEVNEYKKDHPGELNLSYFQFLQKHFDVWARNTSSKIFLDLPYYTDGGMFYHKWTFINRWIKNTMVIEFISLIIFIVFYYFEKDFIKKNLILMVPFLFFVFLSVYDIPQLEGNWLISCVPFFAVPIMQFLQRKIGAYLILLGQLLIVFV